LWVDVVAVAVDGNMMVVPAQGDEVVRMVGSSVCKPTDVVGLEAVDAYTAVYDTRSVSKPNGVSDGWWDCACGW
jgi:hypothetical protein